MKAAPKQSINTVSEVKRILHVVVLLMLPEMVLSPVSCQLGLHLSYDTRLTSTSPSKAPNTENTNKLKSWSYSNHLPYM